MDSVKTLAPNAKFMVIEKVYAGGYCYRARIDVKSLFGKHSFGGVSLSTSIGNPLLISVRADALDNLLFSIMQKKLGERDIRWGSRIGEKKVQCYFKYQDDLIWFAEQYSHCIDEVSHPESDGVLDVLSTPAIARDEMVLYRPSLFFHKYRWRITLVRRNKWRGNDMALLHDWVNSDLEVRLLSEQNVDAKLYIGTESDVNLVRFGFNHLIRKIEKTILHSELC